MHGGRAEEDEGDIAEGAGAREAHGRRRRGRESKERRVGGKEGIAAPSRSQTYNAKLTAHWHGQQLLANATRGLTPALLISISSRRSNLVQRALIPGLRPPRCPILFERRPNLRSDWRRGL